MVNSYPPFLIKLAVFLFINGFNSLGGFAMKNWTIMLILSLLTFSTQASAGFDEGYSAYNSGDLA